MIFLQLRYLTTVFYELLFSDRTLVIWRFFDRFLFQNFNLKKVQRIFTYFFIKFFCSKL